jgi:crotonobetainyl-CoA:carnitine CoA-transferase CaiB-like acyl-CoA transferase
VIQTVSTKNSNTTNRIADKNQAENQSQYPTAAFKFNDNAGPKLHNAPPVFAQHTPEVLSELGYNTQQIKSLEDQEVISFPELIKNKRILKRTKSGKFFN